MFRQNPIENPTRVAKSLSIALRNQSEAKILKALLLMSDQIKFTNLNEKRLGTLINTFNG